MKGQASGPSKPRKGRGHWLAVPVAVLAVVSALGSVGYLSRGTLAIMRASSVGEEADFVSATDAVYGSDEQKPTDQSEPAMIPADSGVAPENAATPPAEEVQPPAEEVQPPVEEAQPPVEEAQPPTEEAQPPTEGAQPPVGEASL